jgi:hypothetical protein
MKMEAVCSSDVAAFLADYKESHSGRSNLYSWQHKNLNPHVLFIFKKQTIGYACNSRKAHLQQLRF